MKEENLKATRNRVIVKLNKLHDHIQLNSGQKLYIDTKYEPAQHTQVIGTVIATPKLYYNKKDIHNSMEWDTPMELEKGDKVFMEYFAVLQCLGTRYDRAAAYEDPKWFEIGDNLYISISYQDIYFAMRGDEFILLNGYMIGKPIHTNKMTSSIVILPDSVTEEISSKFAEVIYPGKSVREYLDPIYQDKGEIKKGDVVIFSRWSNQRVEDSLHQTLFKDKGDYFVIQRRWLRGNLPAVYKSMVENGKLK